MEGTAVAADFETAICTCLAAVASSVCFADLMHFAPIEFGMSSFTIAVACTCSVDAPRTILDSLVVRGPHTSWRVTVASLPAREMIVTARFITHFAGASAKGYFVVTGALLSLQSSFSPS